MTGLSLPIEKLRNVGSQNLPRLRKLGIKTVKDLLWHFPSRYEDYTEILPISDVEPGQKIHIQGEILKISSRHLFPKRMSITNAIIGDQSGAIKVVWFNQPYIENQLIEGTLVSLAGKVSLGKQGLYLSSPTYEKINSYALSPIPYTLYPNLKHTSGLVPIYPETEGVTSKYLRFLIKPLLKNIIAEDPLPYAIKKKHNFPELISAFNAIHFPSVLKDAEKAKERFAFEDLFLLQIRALLERRKFNQLKSIPISFDQKLIRNFISSLPFELTRDQKISLWEIIKDLEKNYPMNRLLEGDVGSGKTIVALTAAYQAAKQGYQTVFMVPTEVLAHQHNLTIISLLGNHKSQITPVPERPGNAAKTDYGARSSVRDTANHKQLPNYNDQKQFNVGFLTGSEARLNNETIKKPELKKKIESGEVKIIIGTHAVLQQDVSFDKLAFVIIDEQHRFGIEQRAQLIKNTEIVPHLLSMTATPIPRTLALTVYGDLDISLIREKPKDRQRINTQVVLAEERNKTYQFIREEIKKGRQAFVICPRIELSDPKKEIKTNSAQSKMNTLWQEVKAVEEEYKKLSETVFPDLKIAMLHGKLKPKEKNEIMNRFKDGWYDILVSTSVVEVGIDIPNATIMAIESAERFGLAQLHQFRGRVGRGEHQSYCLLFSSTGDKSINKRLKVLVDCNDGFELAEKDMQIRGPGEFFGVKQSGMPDLAMASLANMDLIKKARFEARTLLKEDPSLKNYPLLRNRLESFQKMTHFE